MTKWSNCQNRIPFFYPISKKKWKGLLLTYKCNTTLTSNEILSFFKKNCLKKKKNLWLYNRYFAKVLSHLPTTANFLTIVLWRSSKEAKLGVLHYHMSSWVMFSYSKCTCFVKEKSMNNMITWLDIMIPNKIINKW